MKIKTSNDENEMKFPNSYLSKEFCGVFQIFELKGQEEPHLSSMLDATISY